MAIVIKSAKMPCFLAIAMETAPIVQRAWCLGTVEAVHVNAHFNVVPFRWLRHGNGIGSPFPRYSHGKCEIGLIFAATHKRVLLRVTVSMAIAQKGHHINAAFCG